MRRIGLAILAVALMAGAAWAGSMGVNEAAPAEWAVAVYAQGSAADEVKTDTGSKAIMEIIGAGSMGRVAGVPWQQASVGEGQGRGQDGGGEEGGGDSGGGEGGEGGGEPSGVLPDYELGSVLSVPHEVSMGYGYCSYTAVGPDGFLYTATTEPDGLLRISPEGVLLGFISLEDYLPLQSWWREDFEYVAGGGIEFLDGMLYFPTDGGILRINPNTMTVVDSICMHDAMYGLEDSFGYSYSYDYEEGDTWCSDRISFITALPDGTLLLQGASGGMGAHNGGLLQWSPSSGSFSWWPGDEPARASLYESIGTYHDDNIGYDAVKNESKPVVDNGKVYLEGYSVAFDGEWNEVDGDRLLKECATDGATLRTFNLSTALPDTTIRSMTVKDGYVYTVNETGIHILAIPESGETLSEVAFYSQKDLADTFDLSTFTDPEAGSITISVGSNGQVVLAGQDWENMDQTVFCIMNPVP